MTLAVWTDGDYWVVAESKESAFKLLCDGGYYDGVDGVSANDFVQLDDDKELSIIDDTDAETIAECGRITKTCREWCELNGDGFLCASDY